MPPTPFHPTHDTPFKSSISSSQQSTRQVEEQASSSTYISNEWPAPLKSSSLDSRHWTYLAEGAKNLLLRYDGPIVYPFIGPTGGRIALRVRKSERNGVKDEGEDEIGALSWKNDVLQPDLGSSRALPPLLPVADDLIDNQDIRAFVRQMAAKVESMRPIERRKKSGLDETAAQSISITEDLSAGINGKQVLCFEVKPKCGILPLPDAHLDPETEELKRRFSRYRMHRVLKSQSLTTLAEFEAFFDPLQLYSGQKEEVNKAAAALYNDWIRGEGNLRIFVNGNRMESAEVVRMDQLAREHFIAENVRNMLGDLLSGKAVQDVLQTLVRLQAKYDSLDVEGVARLYQSKKGKTMAEAKEPSVLLTEYQEAINAPAPLTLRQAIVQLLLSTMYKDCSIFVRCISGQAPSVHLVDLDPKPISKLPYLLQLDRDVCFNFQEWSRKIGLL